jgi:hypothetical protein
MRLAAEAVFELKNPMVGKFPRLLRTRHQRPRCRPAQSRDELAPSHASLPKGG